MKAIIVTKAGSADVLQLQEVAKPTPKHNEILVKVRAATVTRGDVALRKLPRALLFIVGILAGFKAQKIAGVEFAGIVEQVGSNVQKFKVNDEVFGTTTGLAYGANAEYVCIPESWKQGVVGVKPAKLSFEQAAALPVGGMTALYLLKKAAIQPGQKVLINGASGSVGSYALQLAKHFGAEVTAVCSGKHAELVQSLGADKIIDYTKEDFTSKDEAYDVIFDAVGKLSSSRAKSALKQSGKYLTVKSLTKESTDNLIFIGDLADKGAIKPAIDKRFPLESAAEAHRYVEQGHKAGNVVITIP